MNKRLLAWALLVGFALSACSTVAPRPQATQPAVRLDGRVLEIPKRGPCIYPHGNVDLLCPPRA
jgi:hypothetical protein